MLTSAELPIKAYFVDFVVQVNFPHCLGSAYQSVSGLWWADIIMEQDVSK